MDKEHNNRKIKENEKPQKEPCILIAEDDKEMRSLLYYYLKKFGYRIILCKDGQQLIDKLGNYFLRDNYEESIDLIISDIRMPYASGLKILKQLKNILTFPPMILITAFGSEEIHKEAKRLGAVEVFDKPFDIELLLLKIEELVPSYPFDLKHERSGGVL